MPVTSAIERLQGVAEPESSPPADEPVTAAALHKRRFGVPADGALPWLLLCGTWPVGRDSAARRPRTSRQVDPRHRGRASHPCCGDHRDPGSFCDRVLMEQDPQRILACPAKCSWRSTSPMQR